MQSTGNLPEGTVIHNRYRIVRLVAKGGVGAVYEAFDQRLHNTVALKQTTATLAAVSQPFPPLDTKANINQDLLREILVHRFNESEQRDLCFSLGIDYDNLPTGGIGDKARELVRYCQRHERIAELAVEIQKQRPGALPVILKNETPVIPADTAARAFRREALLLANLRHGALPRVIDHFSEGGWYFMVMDFIPGDDLGMQMNRRRAPFPVDDVMRWADRLLDVLHYLHTQPMPVIHRDIKPHNLKTNSHGDVVLLDFGLAKGTTEQLVLLTSGMSLPGYTLQYAPIEQIEGDNTDSRSDVYSLGATLYHFLIGAPPVTVLQRAKALRKRQPDPLQPPHKINNAVSAAISDIIVAMLALDIEDRPSKAAEVRIILEMARNFNSSSFPNITLMLSLSKPEEQQSAFDIHNKNTPNNRNNARYYNSRGLTKHEQKNFEEAIAEFTKAIALEPAYAYAYYNRGNTYYEQQKFVEAIADYNQAIVINPLYSNAYNSRGSARYRLGDYVQAMADYDKAIVFNPKYVLSYYNRGRVRHVEEDLEGAIADYNRAITLDPLDADTYYYRGLIEAYLKDNDRAADDFRKVLELSNDNQLCEYAKRRLKELGINV